MSVATVFVAIRLMTFDGDITRFVGAGDYFTVAQDVPSVLHIETGWVGFDGQGYYRLALDPFTNDRLDYGIVLDHPAFRQQRILYPVLAWLVGGLGDSAGVAWALVGLNVVGVGAAAALGSVLAQRCGRPATWGLLFAANPAHIIALALDTAEILATTLVLATLVALRARRYPVAAVALTGAALTRETTLVVAIGLALAWLVVRLRRDRTPRTSQPPAYVWLVPAAIQVSWQAYLTARWGTVPSRQGASMDIRLPFVGLLREAATWLRLEQPVDGLHLLLMVVIVTAIALGAIATARGAGLLHERTTFVAAATLTSLMSQAIWFHHHGFLRTNAELFTLVTVLLLADHRTERHRLVLLPAVTGAIALNLLLHP